MASKLLIANCNNTLRESITQPGGYINSPTDQRIIKGAANTLAKLDDTWDLVALHNEGGVKTYNKETGKMFKTIEEAITQERYALKLIREIRPILAIYICPQAKGTGTQALKITSTRNTNFTGDGFRLPMAGMIIEARKAYTNRNTEEILYVGDEDSDSEAAASLGIPFKWAWEWWS